MVTNSVTGILPDYLRELGASNMYIGIYINLPSLELVLFVILSGRFSNFINRKALVTLGFVAYALSSFFMYFFDESLTALFILKIISSTSYAFGFTMIFSLLFDILPEKTRRSGSSIFGISGLAGAPVGSKIGELIFNDFHNGDIFMLSAIFGLFAVLICLFVTNIKPTFSPDNHETTMFDIIFQKKNILLIILTLTFGAAFGVFKTFIPVITAINLGKANISIFFIAFSIIAISYRFFFHSIIDKIKEENLIIISFVFISVALFFVVFINKEWHLYLIGILYGFAHAILFPTLSTSYINRAGNHERIIYTNTFLSLNAVGTTFFATSLGFLGDITTVPMIFISMSIISFIVMIVYFIRRAL